jgi:hypothetical protein
VPPLRDPVVLGAVAALVLALLVAAIQGGRDGPAAEAAPDGGDRARAAVAPAGGEPAPEQTVPPPVVPTGEFAIHPGAGAVVGSGPLVRYRLEVETGVPVTPAQFALEVDEALLDSRGWTGVDGIRLQRSDSDDATVTIVLASPATTDRLCRPLRTNGRYSCFNAGRAVINSDRWLHGADTYPGDLDRYRIYVVNHEVGHALGHGHRGCPRPGAPAPVMVQQTKSLSGCVANPWPAAGG